MAIATWNPFEDVETVNKIYDQAHPTVKRVSKLLQCNTESQKEKEMFDYLKCFLRGLNEDALCKFLCYVTGADMLCVEKIDVIFNDLSGLDRRIVAHTCGPTI
eukprot:gene1847-2080_t